MKDKDHDQHVTHVNTSENTSDLKLSLISNTCNTRELNFSEKEYQTYNQLLADWDVQYRGYILKHYQREQIKEAIARTYFKQDKLERIGDRLRNPGAYFCKVIRSMTIKQSA